MSTCCVKKKQKIQTKTGLVWAYENEVLDAVEVR